MVSMSDDKDRSPGADDWAGPEGELGAYIAEESAKSLNAYREQPHLVDEHANQEEDTARGGYADRQLFELIQNSADALAGTSDGGRIALRLTEDCLYCADDGEPIDKDGVKALMFSHLSPKRGTSEIGRFGLGFKSVLGVTDAPEFFSRSGSFRFDRARSRERIRRVAPDAKRYPALRLSEPIDSRESRDNDDVLRELMDWATNIVRLPLKPEAHDDLVRQMRDFPSEFLLFVEHVRQLTLNDGLSKIDRKLELLYVDGEYLLAAGDTTSDWKLFKRTHPLSGDARADRRSLDDGDEVPIWWAAPLARLTDPGHFWAFFPTHTASLVAGILNAPWKTNEDRQNLLPGPYNEELIGAAAEMVTDELPSLATETDPARHLDALPRRREAGDSVQVELLRKRLFSNLHDREIIPDQDGNPRATEEIGYPPKELTSGDLNLAPFERWAAYPGRPSDWLHHKALTRNRLAAIDRLFPPRWSGDSPAAPRATVAKWLEALVTEQESDAAVYASMAAIQTAALISPEARSGKNLGDIVLTASGDWRTPDPERVFLPDEALDGGHALNPDSFVHPQLVSDSDTLTALKKLGIKPPSLESSFKLIAQRVLDGDGEPEAGLLEKFWISARKLEAQTAGALIREHKDWRSRELWLEKLRVRTRSGDWRPLHSVLLPGDIVPGDRIRDDDTTVDTDFHEPDLELLRKLGVTDEPRDNCDLSSEPWFHSFRHPCRLRFREQDGLPHIPQWSYLGFTSVKGVGPLEVLSVLSDEGKVLYTDALLNLDATYEKWMMQHTGTNQQSYQKMPCESPAIHMLRKHGRIRTPDGIIPFEDALGPQPKSPSALHALLSHPKADRIKEAFDLAEPMPEFIGEEDPVPLTDVWPGLEEHLPAHRKTCQLIHCERILVGSVESECVFTFPNIYLARTDNDDARHELRLVSDGLELNLVERQLEKILQRETRQEIEERRAAVRECSTDAERLLAAVGEDALRRDLPRSLLAILEAEGVALTGVQIAEAAIATYHSDALRQYRRVLDRLDPPTRWAGSARAVDFVRLLGFSAEWAGERDRKRDPFLEVEGPYSLPELHDYQETIVTKVRNMLDNGRANGAERRGMISMPTGSGKTRVAVQAIVEVMRDDGFRGGVLWVADRDELCEQAVEAWRQVWSSIGAETAQLRISRMWAGQQRPLPNKRPPCRCRDNPDAQRQTLEPARRVWFSDRLQARRFRRGASIYCSDLYLSHAGNRLDPPADSRRAISDRSHRNALSWIQRGRNRLVGQTLRQ